MKHLIDLDDFSLEDIDSIIKKAIEIKANPSKFQEKMKGKIIGTLFYEPSTRTQISFQTAMLRLGGQFVGFDNPINSSVAKGENLKDTIKIISGYTDIIAIRHPIEGAAKAASLFSSCPIINAGDGGHLHPTQTLTDLVTLKEQKGNFENLTIGLCGDLKFGRTVHSFVKMMLKYKGNKFIFISTKELSVPEYLKNMIVKLGGEYEECSSLEKSIGNLDVLYMTRIQKERFCSGEEYDAQKDIFKLDCGKMKLARKSLVVMHPLPRVDEIEGCVDDDPRAFYFKQAANGIYARMALILHIFSQQNCKNVSVKGQKLNMSCSNKRCITNTEKYLPKSFLKSNNEYICEYCDSRVK